MVNLIDLTNAMADALRRIPQLVADLDPATTASVIAYIDEHPATNSLSAAVYGQKPGTVLIGWVGTVLTETENLAGYDHALTIFIRAKRGESPYALVDDIMNGIPDPGDGMPWLFCPLLPGLLPTTVPEIPRQTDEEGIDHITIQTHTQELGEVPRWRQR